MLQAEQTATRVPTSEDAERITVIAEEFTPAALEFHRREMGKRGYRVEGPIRAHSFMLLEDLGAPQPMFAGQPYFAVTFVRSGGR